MMAFLSRIPAPLACYLSATAYLLTAFLTIYFAGDPLVLAYIGLERITTTLVVMNVLFLIAAFLMLFEAYKGYLSFYRVLADYYK